MAKLHQTLHGLPGETRAQVADIFNARLAECLDLYFQSKQAHWNVKGPNFIALHELFDEIAGSVSEHADLLAERVVQLGAVAEGTVQVVNGSTSLRAYPPQLVDQTETVQAVASALADFGNKLRVAIEKVDELGDADAADILTEISRSVDKYVWFVEAHLA